MTSRCEQSPGMCCGDPACPDTKCPGRPMEQRNGGSYIDTAMGYESGGIWYAEDEPEIVGPATALFAAGCGLVAVAIILGLCGWAIYTLTPILLSALPLP